jgi:hypothetical protein
VYSVGAGGDGDVGAGVDEEFGRRVVSAEGCEEMVGERGEVFGGEVPLAELEEVDAFGGEARGLAEEGGLTGGLGLLPGFGGEAGAVGDGVTKHEIQFRHERDYHL